MNGSTPRTSQPVLNQAIRGCIPLFQRLLLKLKLLRSPGFSSYLCVINWELILSRSEAQIRIAALTAATPRKEQLEP
jgi:hypothetical protein